ncbi:MAG: hypothetical protein IH948_06455 [Bacteroidetes bacterium]|nr:hypothetical protein [Bacteroidota bacterium]
MKRYWVIFLLLIVFTFSCNDQYEKVMVTYDNKYINKTIGWEIAVPTAWQIIPGEQRRIWTEDGVKKLEAKKLNNGLKKLIAFYKSPEQKHVSLISNMEPITNYPFVQTEEDFWRYYVQLQQDGFDNMGFKNVGFEVNSIEIDNRAFTKINISFYNSEETLIFNQIAFITFINNHVLEILISYKNEEEGNVLIVAVENSRFQQIGF